MRKDKSVILQRFALGFALSAMLYIAAVIYYWDSPILREFFLYRVLPYCDNPVGVWFLGGFDLMGEEEEEQLIVNR